MFTSNYIGILTRYPFDTEAMGERGRAHKPPIWFKTDTEKKTGTRLYLKVGNATAGHIVNIPKKCPIDEGGVGAEVESTYSETQRLDTYKLFASALCISSGDVCKQCPFGKALLGFGEEGIFIDDCAV